MKIFDRLLMTILLFFSMALCVVVILFCFNFFVIQALSVFIEDFSGNWVAKTVTVIVAILGFIMALKVMFFRSKEGTPVGAPAVSVGSSFLKVGEAKEYIQVADNVRMTSEAVNDIIIRSVKEGAEISAAQSTIHKMETGYRVHVDVVALAGTNIPEASLAMEERVKNTLLSSCGIQNVTVEVIFGK